MTGSSDTLPESRSSPRRVRRRLAAAGGVALLAAGGAFGLHASGLLTRVEAITIDWRFRHGSDPARANRQIVIINISQHSLETAAKEMSLSWPWPRAVYGELLDRLDVARPQAVFFDFFFTEQSSYGAEDDRAFAEAIRRIQAVRLNQSQCDVYLPAMLQISPTMPASESERNYLRPVQNDATNSPVFGKATLPCRPIIDALERYGGGLVDVGFLPDADKVGRHYAPGALHDGLVYHSAAFKIAKEHRGKTPWPHPGLPLEPVIVPSLRNTFDVMPIRFHGGPGTHRRVDFLDVMNPEQYPEAKLKEKFGHAFVLIGSDAGGLLDLRPGPFPQPFAGVEFHAAALDNLLNGTFLQPMPGWALAAALAVMAAGAALAVFFLPVATSTIAVSASVAGYGFLSLYLFRNHDLRLDVAGPVLAAVSAYAASAAWSYATEGRRRREARYALEHFIPTQVVNTVLEDLDHLKLGGEKKEITIFFSDLAGFTTLSEKLDPSVLVDVINEYLTAMCRVLHDEGATIDKYVGDAIVAFWGAPLPQKDHAVRACRAALQNQIALNAFREALTMRGLPPVEARIGLNTGVAVVGFMGFRTGAPAAPKEGAPLFGGLFQGLAPGEQAEALAMAGGRFNYTMMGDNVNLGSRLEGVNKEFGTRIMLSETTRAAAGDAIEVRELGLLRVKGKYEPTRIYELLAMKGGLAPGKAAIVARFHEGLAAYRARKFAEARGIFEAIRKDDPEDGPAKIYIELCHEYEASPPPGDWDAVHVMKNK